jgi:hypothetical protein
MATASIYGGCEQVNDALLITMDVELASDSEKPLMDSTAMSRW